jgi:hypothetical protein
MVGPSIPGGQIRRRQLLKVGAAAGAAMTIGQSLLARASATPAEGQGVSSVDHVVFLIQEKSILRPLFRDAERRARILGP